MNKNIIRLKNLCRYKKLNNDNKVLIIKTKTNISKNIIKHFFSNFFKNNKIIKINSLIRKKDRKSFIISKYNKNYSLKIKTKIVKIFIIKFKNVINIIKNDNNIDNLNKNFIINENKINKKNSEYKPKK